MSSTIINAMTCDVEDYFQVSAFEKYIDRDQWDSLPRRVEENTDRLLELFDLYGIKITFFMLGWVAERHPGLITRIIEEGHELASHGYSHIRVTEQTPAEFRQDIDKTKKLLEDMSGQAVRGYRAASYSIGKDNLWALEELEQAGYEYSSSIYPIKHDLYGIPDAPRFAYHPNRNQHGLLEVPVTTFRLGGKNYPCGGGGYFRLFPYRLSRWALQQVNNKDKQACIFYFHPWEIDPKQPRQSGISVRTRFRHYLNLDRMETRLTRLLNDFSWGRMDHIFLGNKTAEAAQP